MNSSRKFHSAESGLGCWSTFSLMRPLVASQTKCVPLGALRGRGDPSASPPCSHSDVRGTEVSSSSLDVCVCMHAHVCTYVSYLFGHGVCVHVSVCSRLYGEGVYALPPGLKFSEALITHSGTGLLPHGPGG